MTTPNNIKQNKITFRIDPLCDAELIRFLSEAGNGKMSRELKRIIRAGLRTIRKENGIIYHTNS